MYGSSKRTFISIEVFKNSKHGRAAIIYLFIFCGKRWAQSLQTELRVVLGSVKYLGSVWQQEDFSVM